MLTQSKYLQGGALKENSYKTTHDVDKQPHTRVRERGKKESGQILARKLNVFVAYSSGGSSDSRSGGLKYGRKLEEILLDFTISLCRRVTIETYLVGEAQPSPAPADLFHFESLCPIACLPQGNLVKRGREEAKWDAMTIEVLHESAVGKLIGKIVHAS
jgi:hypothetical protein